MAAAPRIRPLLWRHSAPAAWKLDVAWRGLGRPSDEGLPLLTTRKVYVLQLFTVVLQATAKIRLYGKGATMGSVVGSFPNEAISGTYQLFLFGLFVNCLYPPILLQMRSVRLQREMAAKVCPHSLWRDRLPHRTEGGEVSPLSCAAQTDIVLDSIYMLSNLNMIFAGLAECVPIDPITYLSCFRSLKARPDLSWKQLPPTAKAQAAYTFLRAQPEPRVEARGGLLAWPGHFKISAHFTRCFWPVMHIFVRQSLYCPMPLLPSPSLTSACGERQTACRAVEAAVIRRIQEQQLSKRAKKDPEDVVGARLPWWAALSYLVIALGTFGACLHNKYSSRKPQ